MDNEKGVARDKSHDCRLLIRKSQAVTKHSAGQPGTHFLILMYSNWCVLVHSPNCSALRLNAMYHGIQHTLTLSINNVSG